MILKKLWWSTFQQSKETPSTGSQQDRNESIDVQEKQDRRDLQELQDLDVMTIDNIQERPKPSTIED